MNVKETLLARQRRKVKIILAVVLTFCAVLLIALNISLPLPESEKGTKVVDGKIEWCEFQRLGKGITSQISVKMKLNGMNKTLGVNAPLNERGIYEEMCNNKNKIQAHFYANRLLVRPRITYWINKIYVYES